MIIDLSLMLKWLQIIAMSIKPVCEINQSRWSVLLFIVYFYTY